MTLAIGNTTEDANFMQSYYAFGYVSSEFNHLVMQKYVLKTITCWVEYSEWTRIFYDSMLFMKTGFSSFMENILTTR